MIIAVESLTYTYPGNKEKTIKEVDFSIEKGEVFGFLGPSGAGKSTIKKILVGILKDYEGTVRVAGTESRRAKPHYYEKIGVAFEVPNLYNKFSAMENLNFFRSLYAGETEDPAALLAMVGLEHDAFTRIAQFSKGMKMRLNFCRAFINKPEIVFLDEPTAGLDPLNTKKIKEIILARKKAGTTVFLATHDMKVAEDICDRVAFIVDGRINLIDSPRALKLQRGQKLVRLEYRPSGSSISAADFNLNGIGHNRAFLDLLRTHDIETMHTLEASLEDIFIEVTGRSLV